MELHIKVCNISFSKDAARRRRQSNLDHFSKQRITRVSLRSEAVQLVKTSKNSKNVGKFHEIHIQ